MVVVLVPATKVSTVVPPEMLTPTWSTLSINSSIRKKNNFHLKTVWLSWSQGSMNFDPTACQRSERQAVDSSCKAFWGSDSLRCSHLIRWRCRGGWRSALLCSGPRAGRWPLHCRSTESRPSHTHRLWWSTFRCCSSAGIRYLRSAQGGDRSPANAVENRCASLRSQLCCLKDREDKETRRQGEIQQHVGPTVRHLAPTRGGRRPLGGSWRQPELSELSVSAVVWMFFLWRNQTSRVEQKLTMDTRRHDSSDLDMFAESRPVLSATERRSEPS